MTPSRGIRFFPFAGRRIAYGLSGTARFAPAWWVSHLELDWQYQRFRRFWEAVGEGFRLVRYDRPGVGLSDRDARPQDPTLDAEVELLARDARRARLRAGDADRRLLGRLHGGRVRGPPPRAGRAAAAVRDLRGGPAIAPVEVREAIVGAVRSHWGLGSRLLADVFLGDEGTSRARGVRPRRSGSRATARPPRRCSSRSTAPTCARSSIACRAPTVVVHRREDRAIPYELGRELAAGDPGGDARAARAATRTFRGSAIPRRSPARCGPGSAPRPTTPTDADAQAALLSPREREVLSLVARGHDRAADRGAAGRQPSHGAPPHGEHPREARARIRRLGGRGGDAARADLSPTGRRTAVARRAIRSEDGRSRRCARAARDVTWPAMTTPTPPKSSSEARRRSRRACSRASTTRSCGSPSAAGCARSGASCSRRHAAVTVEIGGGTGLEPRSLPGAPRRARARRAGRRDARPSRSAGSSARSARVA